MKKILLSLSLVIGLAFYTKGQVVECGEAVYQLQAYANSVNQQYWYYYNNVGNFCGYSWPWCLSNLNAWYYNQCLYVNRTYVQISQACSVRQPQNRPAPTNRQNHDRDIETDEFDDLAEDIEDSGSENKRLRISIPSSPNGWRP